MIIVLIIIVISWFSITPYKPFTINENEEVVSCKTCKCVGMLVVMESYPEQYSCNGFESCKDLAPAECE